MKREPASRPTGLSRREFMGVASAAVGLWLRPAPAWAAPPERRASGDAGPRSTLEREHVPALRVPKFTVNGAKVPIVVELQHPMAPDHHITSVLVVNEADPIPLKGTFHFTPGNGPIHLAFQARMHGGPSDVTATAECNRHGKWSTTRPIEIPYDAGGCTGTAPASIGRTSAEDIRAPVIRIPELVEGRRIHAGDAIHAQLKMRHPNRTGLVLRDGRFVQESEPLHLAEVEVHYGGVRVSRFELTPALSDDPFITFGLLARAGVLRILVRNNRGQKFEASHEIHLS